MTRPVFTIFLVLLCVTLSRSAFVIPVDSTKSASKDSLEKKDQKWDVAAPHGPARDIEFDTDEGTWISVDVSPDGKKIVFDLLGDIYLIPME